MCQLEGSTVVYCFGGWNGKNSVNAIEMLDLYEYISSEIADETKIDDEESKINFTVMRGKSNSTVLSAAKVKTWIPISVKEAGDLSSAPNYRLFNQCNSIG